MEQKTMRALLEQIASINTHYKHLSFLSGEEFNIFQILDITTDEVRLHSAFIAELLNPKGRHGQGTLFLDIFLKQLGNTDLDSSTAIVEIEKHIGFKNEEQITGGRVDILISDNQRNLILIENKIYATDQDKQLMRYHNYCKNSPHQLFYLNLYGESVQPKSIAGHSEEHLLKEGKDYIIISYQTDILDWLEACRKEVAGFPIIREGITHYIHLIKSLTNQSNNKAMEKEVVELLTKSPGIMEAAGKIEVYLSKARAQVQWQFWTQLKQAMQSSLLPESYNLLKEESDLTEELIVRFYTERRKLYPGFSLKILSTKKLDLYWRAEIEDNFYTGFILFERDNSGKEKNVSNALEYKKFRDILLAMDGEYRTSAWWVGWKHTHPRLNFRKFTDSTTDLVDETYLCQLVAKIAQEASTGIKQYKELLQDK